MAKDKYKQIEGLLYSYKELPFRKKNLELDLKLVEDPYKRAELERIETNIAKVDNMLDMIKLNSELDYLIIKLRYIDRLEWLEIEGQLSMNQDHLMKRRRRIFEEKLLSMAWFYRRDKWWETFTYD